MHSTALGISILPLRNRRRAGFWMGQACHRQPMVELPIVILGNESCVYPKTPPANSKPRDSEFPRSKATPTVEVNWSPGNRYRMASIARPALLRQAAATASRKSVASSRAGPTLASKITMQHGIRQSMIANTARVASFHTTSRRPILPPPPRK